MGEIILVRHGQANSTATDEESYDRLSDLGAQQGALLGQWFADHGVTFDRVLTGTLQRHRATAQAMGQAEVAEIDARLNEMDYFNLGSALAHVKGLDEIAMQDFAAFAPQVMTAWHAAEIQGNESFAEFETRVTGVFDAATEPGRRVLCVTSGGVIGMIIRRLLGLDPARMAHVLLPIWNTSFHRIQVMPHGTVLAGYNAIPHLEHPDRAAFRTHY